LSLFLDRGFDCQKARLELQNNAWRLAQDALENKTWLQSLYKQSGDRHSLYSERNREIFYPQFLKIFTELTRQKKFISGISSLDKEDSSYDLAVVDETQNAAVQSHLWIYRLSQRTVFVGDSLQKGKQVFSSIVELEPAIFHLFQQKLSVLPLSKTLRLLPDVAQIANQIVKLYTHLYKGRADALSYNEISVPDVEEALRVEQEKCVHRLVVTENETVTWSGRDDADAAIIVLNEKDKTLAQPLINSANIFTHNEAQGLDFSHTLLFLSEETFSPEKKNAASQEIKKMVSLEFSPLSERLSDWAFCTV